MLKPEYRQGQLIVRAITLAIVYILVNPAGLPASEISPSRVIIGHVLDNTSAGEVVLNRTVRDTGTWWDISCTHMAGAARTSSILDKAFRTEVQPHLQLALSEKGDSSVPPEVTPARAPPLFPDFAY